jgi:sugar (pentulose or hexulose) kinase
MKLRINKLLRNDYENKDKLQRLIVTGGAGKNDEIVKILADVFGTQVWRNKIEGKGENSASMGAAIKARMAFLRQETNSTNDDEIEENYSLAAEPNFENTKIYDSMIENYQELEFKVLSIH